MMKVLVVEDNELNRDMIARRLKARGFEILTAQDGEECLNVVQETPPDLILMDLNLPVLDGWEATRRLKGSSKTKDIPIIALTAHALVRDREASLEVGCDHYETKPIDFNRLVSKIQELGSVNKA